MSRSKLTPLLPPEEPATWLVGACACLRPGGVGWSVSALGGWGDLALVSALGVWGGLAPPWGYGVAWLHAKI